MSPSPRAPYAVSGRVVLITGGSGSLGRHMSTRLLAMRRPPRKIIIFSRDEFKQYEMARALGDDPRLRFFLGDVRDRDRLLRAFHSVDVVIHAAALKQVPAGEYNPFEAIRTNTFGAQNVIEAAIDRGVDRVIGLSTDKAANPINLYGASKLCADKLFIAGNSYAGAKGTRFSVVRYGNVLGSRGSFLPTLAAAREKGVVELTDRRMTRFWITLDQAVDFILACLGRMRGGEIFVPKLPSARLADLVGTMAPGLRMVETGIRPGEKLHEVMVPSDESRLTLELRDHYVLEPAFPWWSERPLKMPGARRVAEGFEYRSDNNPELLSGARLRQFLRQAHVD